MLAESALIGLIGAVSGIAVAFGAVAVLQWLQPAQLPRLDAIAIDLPVLLFAVGVALGSSILSGLGPALVHTRTDAMLAMRGTRGSGGSLARRARATLVVIEIAASIVLLVGAGLLLRSLSALLRTDLGVNTEHVMTAQVDLALGRSVTSDRQAAIVEGLAARISAIPAVRSVGFGAGLPPSGEYMRVSFVLSNAANDGSVSHIVTSVPASPGYFDALQIRLLHGRLFTAADSADASPSVIVNREAARRFFGNENPIGRTLPMGKTQLTIVGVVENVKYTGLASASESVIYRPFGQSPFRLVIIVARTTGKPQHIAAELRQVIRTYDPDISIGAVQPLDQWVSDAAAQPRQRAWMLSVIAIVSLMLAMIGLYGAIAYTTAQRSSEIAVRMAVGAQHSDVMRLVLGEGASLAIAGIALGVGVSWWSNRLLATFLYGVTVTDLPAFALSAVSLMAMAMLATAVPAWRAARVDPASLLRAE
jgi:predicted permease